jgi:ectoine hydroxylase-related dioxygenase (phytanoyl-CoA dioxygenase family)
MENISTLEIDLLKGLWLKTQKNNISNPDFNMTDSFKVLYKLNIGMEETLQYLYHQKPSFDDFLTWTSKFSLAAIETSEENEVVLSDEDLQFWEENGYVVIRQAISLTQCIEAQNAIWEFLEASPDNPESWYKSHPQKKGLMLTFTQHQALHNIRNSSRIRKAYEQLYNTKAIFKTIDKVSFNPPETEHFSFLGSPLHWDVSLALPIPFQLQGLLYLSDVEENGGAFQCVPGFHRTIADWINTVPKDVDIRNYATQTLNPQNITGKTGDFIIWHQALPHCASANRGKSPRMVQYLTYLPEKTTEASIWI